MYSNIFGGLYVCTYAHFYLESDRSEHLHYVVGSNLDKSYVHLTTVGRAIIISFEINVYFQRIVYFLAKHETFDWKLEKYVCFIFMHLKVKRVTLFCLRKLIF